jgi:hypothetical protein
MTADFKTIADFRKGNGPAIRATCRQFVLLCRRLDLFSVAGAPGCLRAVGRPSTPIVAMTGSAGSRL